MLHVARAAARAAKTARTPRALFASRAAPLDDDDALVIPGGESTTMLKLLDRENLFEPLKQFGARKPVFGTCAGAILLATLAASASYIAAPAALRTAVPEANPALSLTAALALTFPFNILFGIPLYQRAVESLLTH